MAKPRGLNIGSAIAGYGNAANTEVRGAEALARGLLQLGQGIGGGILTGKQRDDRKAEIKQRREDRAAEIDFRRKTTLLSLRGRQLSDVSSELEQASGRIRALEAAGLPKDPTTLAKVQALQAKHQRLNGEIDMISSSLMQPPTPGSRTPKGPT